jgi:hypothetical protein
MNSNGNNEVLVKSYNSAFPSIMPWNFSFESGTLNTGKQF